MRRRTKCPHLLPSRICPYSQVQGPHKDPQGELKIIQVEEKTFKIMMKTNLIFELIIVIFLFLFFSGDIQRVLIFIFHCNFFLICIFLFVRYFFTRVIFIITWNSLHYISYYIQLLHYQDFLTFIACSEITELIISFIKQSTLFRIFWWRCNQCALYVQYVRSNSSHQKEKLPYWSQWKVKRVVIQRKRSLSPNIRGIKYRHKCKQQSNFAINFTKMLSNLFDLVTDLSMVERHQLEEKPRTCWIPDSEDEVPSRQLLDKKEIIIVDDDLNWKIAQGGCNVL